jgi:ParB-like chromosome segregation protein Spo0J
MIEWRLEKRLIKDLIPHSKNPRYLNKDQAKQLKTSITKFGLIDVPIINNDNTIIGGHQRISILKDEGESEVNCWVPDSLLTEQEVDELNIRLNKNTGSWDFDILANDWDMRDLVEWGFSVKELTGCFDDVPKIEEECDRCTECNQKLKKKKK